MSVVYLRVTVGLHGLDAPDVQSVVDRLNAVLIPEFGNRYASDVEIEVEEHAGLEVSETDRRLDTPDGGEKPPPDVSGAPAPSSSPS